MTATAGTSTASRPRLPTFGGQKWAPADYTRPLGSSWASDGPRLIALVERYWKMPSGQRVRLDDWQRALICHALERYPLDWPVERLRGRLRYRQVVVSMGRQNGKSLLGGIFALYGLLQHVPGPSVVGIATSVEQANVVYERVKYAVKSEPKLSARMKATGTRGIRHRDDSGGYLVKPALEEGLQSVPITLCVADELHLAKIAMWDSIVNGQRAQRDALIVGITTAGDDTSHLLKRLYRQGTEAMAGEHERFGFFRWQAEEGAGLFDDKGAELPGARAAIEAANPSVACGRVDLDTVLTDVKPLPIQDQQRYTLNRFVAASSTWLPLEAWTGSAADHRGAGVVPSGDLVWSVHRTTGWEWATIAVTSRLDGGRYGTELVASIGRPNLEQLADLLEQLTQQHGGAVVMDSQVLSSLGKELRRRGLEDVYILTTAETCQAAASAYAAITQGKVSHAGDELLTVQMPTARRVNVGEAWRISAAASSTDADAVLATVYGLYLAEVRPPKSIQLF